MKNKIKIMQVTYCLDVGGLEKVVLSLSSHLNKLKYEVSVCALSEQVSLAEEFFEQKIPVYTRPKKRGIDIPLFFKLARLFQKKNIDIVHTHNVGAWLYAGVAAKITGKKIVHTEHSNLFENQKKLKRAEKFLEKITDIIVCDSAKVANHLIAEEKLSLEKIKTILNGVDTRAFDKKFDSLNIRQSVGIEDGDLVLGTVARLAPIKDQKMMLDAFRAVLERVANAKLIIVGDGPARKDLEKHAEFLKLAGHVIFLGERNDVPDILSAFDVFLLTSLSEGLPISILEAMAAGRAVVSTKVGAISEVILDGETGLLVPVGNADVMAEVLKRILADKTGMTKMGEAGRKRVKELFSLEHMVNEYESTYRDVLKVGSRQ